MQFINHANKKTSALQNISRTDFIRYLYQEGVRHGKQNHPDFYKEIISFLDSPTGLEAFEKFKAIDPSRFGINIKHILHNFTE